MFAAIRLAATAENGIALNANQTMKFQLFLLVLTLSNSIFAQTKYYEKIINIGWQIQDARYVQQLNDTAFVVAGSQLQDHEQGIKPFIAIIDPYGNPKNIHYYDTLGINSVRCVTGVFANNELVFSGQYDNYYIGGSDWISISYFLKLDLNGNIKQFWYMIRCISDNGLALSNKHPTIIT
ncbi:MAG: hypothetical protein IPL33_08385 [Sphingobacteriales bacterium]|nr:hypothetical protein [Sphingobacteriales bacterium]